MFNDNVSIGDNTFDFSISESSSIGVGSLWEVCGKFESLGKKRFTIATMEARSPGGMTITTVIGGIVEANRGCGEE
jgi:hypothetical protein